MNFSPELEAFLEDIFKLKKTLEQVLPKEAVEYITELVAKDASHRRFLEITELSIDDKQD